MMHKFLLCFILLLYYHFLQHSCDLSIFFKDASLAVLFRTNSNTVAPGN